MIEKNDIRNPAAPLNVKARGLIDGGHAVSMSQARRLILQGFKPKHPTLIIEEQTDAKG